MERTVSVTEHYNEKADIFEDIAKCPFCKKQVKVMDGEIKAKCRHFVREAHGCGGTVFVFRKAKD